MSCPLLTVAFISKTVDSRALLFHAQVGEHLIDLFLSFGHGLYICLLGGEILTYLYVEFYLGLCAGRTYRHFVAGFCEELEHVDVVGKFIFVMLPSLRLWQLRSA